MFTALGLIFGGTEGVGSSFHVLPARTRSRRCRGRRVPYSCFARSDSFWAVSRASGPFFMFCASGLVFDRTEGVGSRFHVLRSRTRFRLYRGSSVPFSCFALPESFSAVPRSSGPVFMFCAPILIFGGAECVVSRFHVLRARTHFRRYRGRRVPFSCFTLPDSISVVRRASGPIFMSLPSGHVFGGIEGVGSGFQVLRSGLIFGDTESDGSRFQVYRSRTHFRRYRGRRVPFSCFGLPNSFSAIPRALGPVFMFCAPGHVFGGAECVGSRFHVLRDRNRFRRF
jgi:hypothetical protein